MYYGKKKRTVPTFSDVSQLEVVIVVEGVLCPTQGVAPALVPLLLWQRAGQEPEGNAGDEQEAGRYQEAHPPGSHPAGIFRGDAHTFWMTEKGFRVSARQEQEVWWVSC